MKISWSAYHKNQEELNSNLLKDPCKPYRDAAISALDGKTSLGNLERGLLQAGIPQVIINNLIEVITDFRNNIIQPVKDEFRRNSSRAHRKEAYHFLKKIDLTLEETKKNVPDFSDAQLKILKQSRQKRKEAIYKIERILKNPINGFKHDVIPIITDPSIQTKDVQHYLPEDLMGVARRFAVALIKEEKRKYAEIQHAFKDLNPGVHQTFSEIVNQQGEFQTLEFKHIRYFTEHIKKGGTAKYIDNSGTASNNQANDVGKLTRPFRKKKNKDKVEENLKSLKQLYNDNKPKKKKRSKSGKKVNNLYPKNGRWKTLKSHEAAELMQQQQYG